VLNEEWKPIYTANHIIETFIPQLLTYPNPDDPLNIDAGKLFKLNPNQFNTVVKNKIFQNSLKK
jgi:ubiquitin-conjugating enzyme E2 H